MFLDWHTLPEDDFEEDEEDEDEFDDEDEEGEDEEDEEEGTWYVGTELSDSLDFACRDSL